ncbi:acyl-CoA dehydrogenase family protein [Nocardia sp. NBC_01377]|uniref:acyl-CoA dehydrogenase family protein n=1 Tax=Nocardia sp. NBC_01377 TaxID=2903595 RepID=UPI0032434BC7
MTAVETATGPAAAVTAADRHPFVAKVREYAETRLRPRALTTDRDGVAEERVDELAALGLLNHAAPPEYCGAGVDRAVDRRVHEIIAGACFNTWLVWAQHASLSQRMVESTATGAPLSALARRILRGELLLGAGVSDVRRFPDHYIAARETDFGVASDARSHHFGLAETVLDELESTGYPEAVEVAAIWRPRIARIRAAAYELTDEARVNGGGPYRVEERLATKVASGEALSALTRALLIARSGRGLAGDDTAQLHARSALFILVQGQTPDVRRAQLARLASWSRPAYGLRLISSSTSSAIALLPMGVGCRSGVVSVE